MAEDNPNLVDPYWRYGPGNSFVRPRGRGPGSEVLRPGQVLEPSGSFGGLNLLGVLEEYLDMKKSIETVAEGIRKDDFLRSIERQLAPGQEVKVLFTIKLDGRYDAIRIDKPGMGYLYDPEQMEVATLRGKRLELCYIPGHEPLERMEFVIDGETKYLSAKSLNDPLSDALPHEQSWSNREERERLGTDKQRDRNEDFDDLDGSDYLELSPKP